MQLVESVVVVGDVVKVVAVVEVVAGVVDDAVDVAIVVAAVSVRISVSWTLLAFFFNVTRLRRFVLYDTKVRFRFLINDV